MKTVAKVLSLVLLAVPFSANAISVSGEANVGIGTGAVTTETKSETSVQTGTKGSAVDDVSVGGGAEAEVTTQTQATAEVTINGDPDFDLFVEVVKEENQNVEAVDAKADGAVEVSYNHKGYLFGFIPLTVTSRTSVVSDAQGNVDAKVSLPWWSFLVSGVSEIRSNVETSLEANTAVKANAAVSASADARARLVEAVVSSVNKVDAEIRASYDLKANVK